MQSVTTKQYIGSETNDEDELLKYSIQYVHSLQKYAFFHS